MAASRGKQIRFWPDLTIPEHKLINDYFESLPHDGRGTRKGRELETALYRYVLEKMGYRRDGSIPEQGVAEPMPASPPPPVSPAPAQPAPGNGAGSPAGHRRGNGAAAPREERTSADSLVSSIDDSVGG